MSSAGVDPHRPVSPPEHLKVNDREARHPLSGSHTSTLRRGFRVKPGSHEGIQGSKTSTFRHTESKTATFRSAGLFVGRGSKTATFRPAGLFAGRKNAQAEESKTATFRPADLSSVARTPKPGAQDHTCKSTSDLQIAQSLFPTRVITRRAHLRAEPPRRDSATTSLAQCNRPAEPLLPCMIA
jgi:hypothetical protein